MRAIDAMLIPIFGTLDNQLDNQYPGRRSGQAAHFFISRGTRSRGAVTRNTGAPQPGQARPGRMMPV